MTTRIEVCSPHPRLGTIGIARLVFSGASLMCSMGSGLSKLTVLSPNAAKENDKSLATIDDHLRNANTTAQRYEAPDLDIAKVIDPEGIAQQPRASSAAPSTSSS